MLKFVSKFEAVKEVPIIGQLLYLFQKWTQWTQNFGSQNISPWNIYKLFNTGSGLHETSEEELIARKEPPCFMSCCFRMGRLIHEMLDLILLLVSLDSRL